MRLITILELLGKVIEAMEEKCDSLMANYTQHLYGKYNRNIYKILKSLMDSKNRYSRTRPLGCILDQ